MRHQPRTRQRKHRVEAGAITAIRDAVERDAIRWGCSRSWIMATALAAFYGIEIAKPYEEKKPKLRRVS